MTETIDVAVIEPVGGHGGCTYYDFSLCRALNAAGYQSALYTCDKTDITGSEGFSIKRPFVGIYGKDPAWLRGFRFLRGALKSLLGARLAGAKIAHFHFYHVGALELFNVVVARMLGMRVVVTAHDVEAFKQGLSVEIFVKWAYGLSHAVIAHNNVSKQELVERINIPPGKISVIKHGNHAEYIRSNVTRPAALSKLNLDDDDFIVVFFGQIKEVKGVDVLLKAIPLVKRQLKGKLKLVIAGRVWKDDFTKYQQLIDALGISDVVDLHIKYISDEDLPMYYEAADIMALPYKKIYQSGVVLMAMTFGKPVLVSDIPGMTEVVTEGVTGFVFKSGDHEDMARQLIYAAENSDKLAAVAKQGQVLMLNDYAWGKIGRETAVCYRNIGVVPKSPGG